MFCCHCSIEFLGATVDQETETSIAHPSVLECHRKGGFVPSKDSFRRALPLIFLNTKQRALQPLVGRSKISILGFTLHAMHSAITAHANSITCHGHTANTRFLFGHQCQSKPRLLIYKSPPEPTLKRIQDGTHESECTHAFECKWHCLTLIVGCACKTPLWNTLVGYSRATLLWRVTD